jgi:hypothetical protein
MRTRIRLTTVAVVVLATAVVGACRGRERAAPADSASAVSSGTPVEDTSALARSGRSVPASAGDSVGIVSRGGAIILSVAHDSVSMGFSPATLDKIRRETDTTGTGTGLGAMIERTVKSGVQSMLSKRVMVPVDDIESVRYDDGAIRFTYRTGRTGIKLEDIKIDKQPALESFSEADARAFVTAVEARLQAAEQR